MKFTWTWLDVVFPLAILFLFIVILSAPIWLAAVVIVNYFFWTLLLEYLTQRWNKNDSSDLGN